MRFVAPVASIVAASLLVSPTAFAQATSQPSAPAAQASSAQASATQGVKFSMQYGFCFADGQNAVYEKNRAQGVDECKKRCEADAKCVVFEIWEHTLICKLYNRMPQNPRPQSVFPNNKTSTGEQAQAAIGVKVVRGF